MNKQLQIINGTIVRLRPITMADTPMIVKWRNNPSVRQNFIFRELFTNKMHEEWMRARVVPGEVVQYIIEEIPEQKAVGSVYLRDIDPVNSSAEFGIFIGEDDARGKGIGTEATRLFVKYSQEKLDIHRIFLRVIAENQAAYNSYLKAGFQREGIFRDMVKLDNEYHDVVFMAVINESE